MAYVFVIMMIIISIGVPPHPRLQLDSRPPENRFLVGLVNITIAQTIINHQTSLTIHQQHVVLIIIIRHESLVIRNSINPQSLLNISHELSSIQSN